MDVADLLRRLGLERYDAALRETEGSSYSGAASGYAVASCRAGYRAFGPGSRAYIVASSVIDPLRRQVKRRNSTLTSRSGGRLSSSGNSTTSADANHAEFDRQNKNSGVGG